MFKFIFLISSILFCPAYSQENKDLKVIVLSTGEWAPYHSQSLLHGGFGNHVITEAFKLSGYKVIYKWYPWKRVINSSREGIVDGVAVWGGYKDWYEDHHGSDEIYSDQTTIFYKKDKKINWRDPNDMNGLAIGKLSSDKMLTQLEKYKFKSIHDLTDESQAFQMLLNGRIDIIAINQTVGNTFLNNLEPKKRETITSSAEPIKITQYRVIFPSIPGKSERNIEFMEALNQGLFKLKLSGKYSQMYQNFINGKYKRGVRVPALVNPDQ